jgi:hypothetical protein
MKMFTCIKVGALHVQLSWTLALNIRHFRFRPIYQHILNPKPQMLPNCEFAEKGVDAAEIDKEVD